MVVKKRHHWTKVKIQLHDIRAYQIINWLTENFGRQWGIDYNKGTWQFLWSGESTTYDASFANEEDAVLFSLRWLGK